ncbi:MAG: hypothetical protein IM446_11905 [Microcystis sp. M046S1]|uniref:hypothetical protein n=1 Tax=Microcystis sp. M046S1 TaxID=2771118 RepID=UPI00258D651A|nr:hypothetical protein [Microcystis sp. M046S1]MCA2880787.1 hypothetical protein [Microcystis sp. M046S1]
MSKSIPDDLLHTLYDLAKRSQLKVEQTELQLRYFQEDVENWFDQSMARASGVYKRNAKFVSFVLGFIIALAANADTFHVVDRLAKDQALRESVNRTVDAIVEREKGELTSEVQNKIKAESDKLALPIGWGKDQLIVQQSKAVLFLGIDWRRIAGWLISGLAISMGAGFWFDLLGKFIDIKNVGRKTPDSSDSNTSTIQK